MWTNSSTRLSEPCHSAGPGNCLHTCLLAYFLASVTSAFKRGSFLVEYCARRYQCRFDTRWPRFPSLPHRLDTGEGCWRVGRVAAALPSSYLRLPCSKRPFSFFTVRVCPSKNCFSLQTPVGGSTIKHRNWGEPSPGAVTRCCLMTSSPCVDCPLPPGAIPS